VQPQQQRPQRPQQQRSQQQIWAAQMVSSPRGGDSSADEIHSEGKPTPRDTMRNRRSSRSPRSDDEVLTEARPSIPL
jgi:hypothetical protein